MGRVVHCPGSCRLQARYERKENLAALEGTAAHGLAAACLTENTKPVDYLGQEIAPGVIADAEMVRAVTLYVDTCRQYMGAEYGIEKSHTFEDTTNGNTLSGTPDLWAFDQAESTLRILDLKYGFGWVEVFENWQFLSYAALICMGGRFENYWPTTIELIVVQPRANHPDGPVRKWRFPAVELRNYADRLFNAMGLAAQESPTTHSGDHCRYCAALCDCHSAGAATGAALDYSGTAGILEQTPDSIAWELSAIERALPMLKQRQVALEETAMQMVKTGQIVPGYETRQVYGSLAWNVDAIQAGDALGVDLRQDPKPITPTQTIQRKLLTEPMVKQFAARKPGAFALKKINMKAIRSIVNG